MPQSFAVALGALDPAAVARALSQLAERDDDLADAYFERLEVLELSADGRAPGLRWGREEGFAIRLLRGGRTWLAARDEIAPAAFSEAFRQVARAMPSALYPEPVRLLAPPAEPLADARVAELAELPFAVHRAIRARHVAFAIGLSVREHRREIQVVGPRVVADPETERFYSLRAALPWGVWGELLPTLDGAAERVAEALVERFRCRNAAPPAPGTAAIVFAPAAAAVLLHEVVAHALEADVLALSGRPEAALGLPLGPPGLSVLDDPAAAPEPVRRATDDEGSPVVRRWLLRDGAVDQPLADRVWARDSTALIAGAGRRGGRHDRPVPRSTHLELVAGELDEDELLAGAEGGLLVSEVTRGALDPFSGRFVLDIPSARRIRHAQAADPVGAFRLEGSVGDLLARVAGVGREAQRAGAGWCAKSGQRLPVWATAPALLVSAVEVGA